METVTVNAKALRSLLEAALGPSHLMGELRVCYDLSAKGLTENDDPISVLVEEYNKAVEAHNAKDLCPHGHSFDDCPDCRH
jgi:hypothetical protein